MRQDEVVVREENMPANDAQTEGAPIQERVAKQVRTLEGWYAAEFERRLTELSEMLKMQLQIQVEELQQHYERREKAILEKAILEKAQSAAAKVVQSTAHHPEKLLEEIKKTEAVAQKCAAELERMVADDSVNLGLLLQMRNQQMEVRAYLRGLKYSFEGGQTSSPASQPPHEII